MVKVETLNLKDVGLTTEEKMAPGRATVSIGSDTTLKGMCHFKRDGMNLVAAIQAGGVSSGEATLAPSDITVEVEKDIVREFEVTAAQTSVNTGLGADLKAATLDGTPCTVSSGVITISAQGEKKTLTFVLTVAVAEGTASDPNVNAAHSLALDAGPVKMSMICLAEKAPGAKPSKTRCSIRGRKPWITIGEDAPLHLKN